MFKKGYRRSEEKTGPRNMAECWTLGRKGHRWWEELRSSEERGLKVYSQLSGALDYNAEQVLAPHISTKSTVHGYPVQMVSVANQEKELLLLSASFAKLSSCNLPGCEEERERVRAHWFVSSPILSPPYYFSHIHFKSFVFIGRKDIPAQVAITLHIIR